MKYYLPSPKPGHTTGGSRRGARRGGGAGSSRTICQQNCPPSGQSFLVPSKASKTRRLNVSPEARISKILCKPMEEQNPRLTTGSSPVYQRLITGTRSALSSWLLTSGPTPFCLCKPFSCKACPGMRTPWSRSTCTAPEKVSYRGRYNEGGCGNYCIETWSPDGRSDVFVCWQFMMKCLTSHTTVWRVATQEAILLIFVMRCCGSQGLTNLI